MKLKSEDLTEFRKKQALQREEFGKEDGLVLINAEEIHSFSVII